MKTFLGVPILQSVPSWQGLLKHYLEAILFTALFYFISAMIYGSLNGDIWMYIQSETHHYSVQAMLLLTGVIGGFFIRKYLIMNNWVWKYDIYFYIVGYIFTFLILNEIGGL